MKQKVAQVQANIQLENQAKKLLDKEREKRLNEQKIVQPIANVPPNVSIDGIPAGIPPLPLRRAAEAV